MTNISDIILDSNNNEIKISKLDNLEIISTDFSFNKKSQEIIILDNEIIDETWSGSYLFINLEEYQLQYIYPKIFLSSYEVYADSNYWSSLNYNWWEQYNSNFISSNISHLLKFYIEGSITNDSNAPIFLTIKLKILNTKLFDLITKY